MTLRYFCVFCLLQAHVQGGDDYTGVWAPGGRGHWEPSTGCLWLLMGIRNFFCCSYLTLTLPFTLLSTHISLSYLHRHCNIFIFLDVYISFEKVFYIPHINIAYFKFIKWYWGFRPCSVSKGLFFFSFPTQSCIFCLFFWPSSLWGPSSD